MAQFISKKDEPLEKIIKILARFCKTESLKDLAFLKTISTVDTLGVDEETGAFILICSYRHKLKMGEYYFLDHSRIVSVLLQGVLILLDSHLYVYADERDTRICSYSDTGRSIKCSDDLISKIIKIVPPPRLQDSIVIAVEGEYSRRIFHCHKIF